jgi:hypothetical protein
MKLCAYILQIIKPESLSVELWSSWVDVRLWDYFCRWMALSYIFILYRPIHFYIKNGLDDPLPPWDPIVLLSWMPPPSILLLILIISISIFSSLLVIALGPRLILFFPMTLLSTFSLALIHSHKYLNHRDGFFILSLWAICSFPVKPAQQRVSLAPTITICIMWCLIFVSSAAQKLLSADIVVLDQNWYVNSVSTLEVYGWQTNQLILNVMQNLSEYNLAIYANISLVIIELIPFLFITTARIKFAIIGIPTILIFKLALGIAFWEILLVSPVWILFYLRNTTPSSMSFFNIKIKRASVMKSIKGSKENRNDENI